MEIKWMLEKYHLKKVKVFQNNTSQQHSCLPMFEIYNL